ncbi:Hypothetical protein BC94_0074 [Mycoplasmopsis bovis]|uniref:Uncharacterized protein n=1 Tax=Mycoplasmopsis bovis TaxID=28903 RepID=A0A8D4D5W0_MYCBV|nr:Hypothetical protein BC85_0074 [Mycoplasmopsis bovis]AMW25423.1 Hypothetical protein BC94_0074 [Mycoplasmopsis bovis]AMW26054.1 Hypothetical protein BC93_0074 [Mycoplasmopsis bovis]
MPFLDSPDNTNFSTASAKANCNSVFTLIFVTPRLIALTTCSVGIPLPPCKTIPISVALEILLNVSKSNDFHDSGYLPWILPIPAAKTSIPVSFILSASETFEITPADAIPSSSPPIAPTSASTETLNLFANSTTALVLSKFSSIESIEPSNITEVKPASIALKHDSKSPWSKWRTTGTEIFKSLTNDLTNEATVLKPPIYLIAPILVPKITGDLNSLAVTKMFLVHSRLFIFTCGTAYLFFLASNKISFALVSVYFSGILIQNLL